MINANDATTHAAVRLSDRRSRRRLHPTNCGRASAAERDKNLLSVLSVRIRRNATQTPR